MPEFTGFQGFFSVAKPFCTTAAYAKVYTFWHMVWQGLCC
jgi:hypothetical protein